MMEIEKEELAAHTAIADMGMIGNQGIAGARITIADPEPWCF
jgi:hypothetical protein